MGFLAQKIMVIVMMFKIASTLSKNFGNETAQLIRSKRIIYGTPLDSHSPFESPNWFANIYIGSGWSTFKLDLYRKHKVQFFADAKPSPGEHWCGGSMLTPTIVGTAAHCVSYETYKNETFDWCPRFNGWENYYAVFVGYFTVRDVEDNLIPGSFAWTKKYMVHENCGLIYANRTTDESTRTHDFAIAFLDREITFPKPGTHPVPAYNVFDILKMYIYIQQRESICLVIGFGAYYWEAPGIKGDPSPVMMHAWRNVRNYRYCEPNDPVGEDEMEYLGYDYRLTNTAVCHTFFGKIRSQTMPGDSGSPVTCDNMYVGSHSRGRPAEKPPEAGEESLSWFSAIAFTVEWHSANYRKSFLKTLKDFASVPEKTRVLAYFDQQEAKPNPESGKNGSSIFWLSSTAFAISIVLCSYQLEI